jgi:hypothetical protein
MTFGKIPQKRERREVQPDCINISLVLGLRNEDLDPGFTEVQYKCNKSVTFNVQSPNIVQLAYMLEAS